MVGDFAVGKTSLTQKFVNNIFSEKYLTTIGVKIDSAMVGDTKLIVWDVAGRDSQSPINTHYLVGADGVILVGDGTRSNTVDALESLWQTTIERTGEIPMVVALNKHDDPAWSVSDTQMAQLQNHGWSAFNTSAKTGENVRELFEALTRQIS